MDIAQQRAAQRAANKLLREAGYDAEGKRQDITRARIKPETPIQYPEGLTKAQRKEHRKQVLLKRGEAVLDHRGQLVTAVEQKIRRARKLAPVKKQERRARAKALEVAKHQQRLERRADEAKAALSDGPRQVRVVKRTSAP